MAFDVGVDYAHLVIHATQETACGAPVPIEDGTERPQCPMCVKWLHEHQRRVDTTGFVGILPQSEKKKTKATRPSTNRSNRMFKRCQCTCTLNTGEQCNTRVYDSGERFCLSHRDPYERQRIRRIWRDLREQRKQNQIRIPHVPWRLWRSLNDDDIWASTTCISRNETDGIGAVNVVPCAIAARDSRDRYYEDTTLLYRKSAALNWPFGRNNPRVRRYMEGTPGRSTRRETRRHVLA